MARRRNNTRSRARKGFVQVREDGDMAAAKIDRTLSSMRANESATVVVCKSTAEINVASGAASFAISYTNLVGTDDFASLAAQYNTFKVKSMRFEVFHINPSVQTPVAVSTLHGDFTGEPPTTWVTEQAVIDSPDAMYLEPGSKKQVFYWNARGTQENAFQDVNSFTNYGGLRYYVSGGTAQTAYKIITSYVVVFRGRH